MPTESPMRLFYALRNGLSSAPWPPSTSQLYCEKILLPWFEKPVQTARRPSEILKLQFVVLDFPVSLGEKKDFLLSNVYKERQKNIWTIIQRVYDCNHMS